MVSKAKLSPAWCIVQSCWTTQNTEAYRRQEELVYHCNIICFQHSKVVRILTVQSTACANPSIDSLILPPSVISWNFVRTSPIAFSKIAINSSILNAMLPIEAPTQPQAWWTETDSTQIWWWCRFSTFKGSSEMKDWFSRLSRIDHSNQGPSANCPLTKLSKFGSMGKAAGGKTEVLLEELCFPAVSYLSWWGA